VISDFATKVHAHVPEIGIQEEIGSVAGSFDFEEDD
jgi:hypothetical protein